MEILEEKPITFSEAREILEKRAEDKKYEIVNALEHVRKFSTLPIENVVKMKDELRKLNKLSDSKIVEICNFMPKTKEELRVILHKEYTSFEESELNKIIEIVKAFS